MSKRSKSPVRVTGPRVRVGKRGIKLQAPRARIGGKTGVNISKSGISASVRTGHGSLSTRTGWSGRLLPRPRARNKRPGCLSVVILVAVLILTIH